MTDCATAAKPALAHVAPEVFKQGMACLAGAVNIVTTDGPAGRAGFTATAVCSVTDTPPTLLVCLNRGSSAAKAVLENGVLCVNTTGPRHETAAMLFGGKTPMEERFANAEWTPGPSGAPILTDAVVSFDCHITERQTVGTHEVLFCEVVAVSHDAEAPASAYFGRRFHALHP